MSWALISPLILTATKQASLQIGGKLALSATSLASITTDFQMDLTRNEYQALSQMTKYFKQTSNPAAQQAAGMALLASLSSLSVDITDRGMLDLFTRIHGDQGINIAILMMQVSLSEAIPRHALAISTPIAAFLQTGRGAGLTYRDCSTPLAGRNTGPAI